MQALKIILLCLLIVAALLWNVDYWHGVYTEYGWFGTWAR